MGSIFSRVVDTSPRTRTILPMTNWVSWPWYGPDGPPVVQVVVEEKGRLYLIPVNITNVDSVQVVMEKVQVAKEKTFRGVFALKLLHDTFWGQRVGVATLCTIRHVRALGHRAPLDVNVRNRETCIDLDRPDLTDVSEPFVALFPELLKGNNAHKCVLVERKLKKQNILLCAFVGILIAVVAGMLVGVFTRNIESGVGTSAGIIGAIALLVPLSTWVIEHNEAE